MLSGDGRLLNTFFGTSFGGEPALEPSVHADLCSPFGGAPAPILLLFVPAAVVRRDAEGVASDEATTGRVPPGVASMSDVWLAMLPLDAGGECVCTDAICASVADALAGLGVSGESQSETRQLVLLAYESSPAERAPWDDQAAAAAAASCAIRIRERLQQRTPAASGGPPRVAVSHLFVPSGGAGCDSAARELASMLLRPAHERYLLAPRPPFGSAAVPFRCVLPLLRALQRKPARGGGASLLPRQLEALALPATSAEWATLRRCQQGCADASVAAAGRVARLRASQKEASLNPSTRSGAELDLLVSQSLAQFDAAVRGCENTPAHAAFRLSLQRTLAAHCLRLTRSQLGFAQRAAFDSFCGDLVEKMHTARKYAPAARRLRRKQIKAFQRDARTALVSSGATRAAAEALLARTLVTLEAQLGAEVALRRGEGEELDAECPMPGDELPKPWYKQIYLQLLAAGFQAAQFYILQYLPAKHRNLANERAVPRGPLF